MLGSHTVGQRNPAQPPLDTDVKIGQIVFIMCMHIVLWMEDKI